MNGLYGTSSESTGLYGVGAASGGTYFEWFIFQDSLTAPATPTGGSWSFTTNIGTAPSGWVVSPPPAPVNKVWVSIAVVDSRNATTLAWSVPGLMASSAAGGGDVVGPASATDNALARFNTTTGELIQNSVAILDDSGNLTGIANLTVNDNTILGSSNSDTVNFEARVNSDIDPSTNNTYDLGRNSHAWRNLYLTGTANIAALSASGAGTFLGGLGVGTGSPSPSAILDAQSTIKGVRMPNMTTTQKNAIASPAAGLMVFDTTLAKLCVYSGSSWETITSS
jgi:hypothetical protein